MLSYPAAGHCRLPLLCLNAPNLLQLSLLGTVSGSGSYKLAQQVNPVAIPRRLLLLPVNASKLQPVWFVG